MLLRELNKTGSDIGIFTDSGSWVHSLGLGFYRDQRLLSLEEVPPFHLDEFIEPYHVLMVNVLKEIYLCRK